MLDSSPIAIAYLGSDLTLRFANRAYLEHQGQTRESIIGKHLSDLYEEDAFEAVVDRFVDAINGTSQEFESPVVTGERSANFHTKLVPNFDADGNVNGVFSYYTDQTAQTSAARSFGSVMNSIPGRVCFVDANYRILYANNSMRNQYALLREEKDVYLSDLLKGPDWKLTKRNIDVAFTGQHVHFQNRFSFQANNRQDMSIYLTPTKTVDQSEVAGVYMLALDATELTDTKNQLHRAEKNFDLALKSHLVAFWELHPDKDDWIFSEHIERLLGLTKGELNNSVRRLLARIHPDDRTKVIFDIASDNSQNDSYVEELRCQTATGEYHWFRLVGNRENDIHGNTLSLAGTLADINDLKNAEILAADRLTYRDSFLSMLSHELRNPVAGIQYAIDILENDPEGLKQLSPECKTSYGIVKRQTKIITRLLNDLLHVGRVSQNQILFEKDDICFSELLKEIVETAESVYAKKHQTLNFSCDATREMIVGDRIRLTQAFINLIDNASKFSQPGSAIEVTCQIEGDTIVTTVSDRGKGIAPEAVAKTFDLFFQEEQPLDRDAGGLGVGLYLVKKIADAHEGSVSVESQGRQRGCDFTIRLPIRGTTNASVTNQLIDKLVLVEDNDDARLALSMALESRGFDVTTFADGQLAVDNIPGLTPKIVLIDIGLPGKDGLKVIRELKQHAGLDQTFFVALTGYGQQHERAMILEAGFDNHMVKPVDISELCSVITKRSLA